MGVLNIVCYTLFIFEQATTKKNTF